MPRSRAEPFTTIRSEGALLPPDFLRQIAEGWDKIPGLTPEAYHLPGTERLNEAASRSWNRLLGAWGAFQTASQSLAETDPGTGITREKWLLPLFQELGYGRLLAAKTFEVEGKPYPISHAWQHTPIHLVGRNVDLDRRSPGVAGAAKASPHGLVQEFLNRSADHLWGLLSNGIKLRILRESKSLTRQAYIEFDLAGMMEGQVYTDFAILWLLCHQSRVEAERPTECWLEKWAEKARQEGTRALDTLRDGVEKAIEVLGRGFLGHPANGALVEKLRSGSLSTQDYYRQLLRAVYRLIFLFVAEDRDLLLIAPRGSKEREQYLRYYSMDRIRSLAERRRGTPHGDLWQGLFLVFQKLGSDSGCSELGLPALGSYLWSPETTPDLDCCALANAAFLEAIRNLAFTVDAGIRRVIDFRNLGPEELGSVYESLLELHPDLSVDVPTFTLRVGAGHERKTTGSYYTPDSLVQCLLDSALEPVMDEAVKGKTGEDAAKALLALKVCDPAVGSGHFLIAAAHRLARRVAAARTGDEEPSPEAIRTTLRDVIGRCLYGVDVNPMAAELCRVNLWLEALEPGKPLSFLDHHIRVGNSLIGATPELIAAGLPDDAFTAIQGDDRKACAVLKERNKAERAGVGPLFAQQDAEIQARLQVAAAALEELPDDRPEHIRAKELAFRRHEQTEEYRQKKKLADAWCAAFVIKTHFREPSREASASGITQGHLNDLAAGRRLPADLGTEADRVLGQYQFFHWHMAFPEVFAKGGFDCVLGNPPWEMPEVDDREFFAVLDPNIAAEPSAQKRRALIADLAHADVSLWGRWRDHIRRHESERVFFTASGRFPDAANGRLNYYKLFLEAAWSCVGQRGRLGMVVPSVLTTNAYERPLWHGLVKTGHVASVIDFENKEGLFPGVHRSSKFLLLILSMPIQQSFMTGCWLCRPSEVSNSERVMSLTVADLAKFSPEELALPQFRSRRDLDLLSAATDHLGRLADHPDWSHTPRLMFSSSDAVFQPVPREVVQAAYQTPNNRRSTREGDTLVPVYEGKMVGILDHRQADIYINPNNPARLAQERTIPEAERQSPSRFAIPQFWLREEAVRQRRFGKTQGDWELVFCDVTSSTNERTALACIIGLSGLTRSLPAIYLNSVSAEDAALLVAAMSAFVFDYFARLKVSSNHLTQGILATLPLPPLKRIHEFAKDTFDVPKWFEKIALELTYTAWDLEPFARECGWDGPPFRWDADRRFRLRCELDAGFFHLYGIGRDDLGYIMDTFPIVRRKDEKKHDGDYRTKRVILEIYDAMQESIRTGHPYQTRLDPPPADPRCCHPPRGS